MAKFLISTLPVTGHIKPAVAAARKLIAAGHSVVFAFPQNALSKLPTEVTQYSTSESSFDYKPVAPSWHPLKWLQMLRDVERNIRYVLADWTVDQIDGIRFICAVEHPDFIISDCLHLAPLIVARERGLPSAVLGVTPYRNVLPKSAPVRTGLPPASGPIGGVVWNAINRLLELYFARTRRAIADQLLHVAPKIESAVTTSNASIFGACQALSDVYLQCSVPALEDRPELLGRNGVIFVGPLGDAPLSPDQHHAWMHGSRLDPPHQQRKTALVTWGTMQTEGPPEKFIGASRALCRLDNVVVIVAPPDNHREEVAQAFAQEVATGKLQFTESFEDFLPKLKSADVFISNGGFGAVKSALALGIPVVCCGDQDDKPDVCGRVTRSGAGIGLQWYAASPGILAAARKVLEDHSFRHRAEEVGWSLHGYDASDRLEQVLSSVAASRVGNSF